MGRAARLAWRELVKSGRGAGVTGEARRYVIKNQALEPAARVGD